MNPPLQPALPEPDGRLRLDAQPSKRILLTRARAIPPDIAFYELVDNAVDEWRKNKPGRDLNVRLHFHFVGDRCTNIRIDDDGGGVEPERLIALVKTGTDNPNPNAIGVFGEGLKYGCVSLAEDIQFLTRPREGPGFRIDWPQAWWEHNDWTFWAVPIPDDSVAPGTLTILLTNLRAPLRRDEIIGPPDGDGLLARLGRTYAPLLSATESPRLNLIAVVDNEPIPVRANVFGDPAKWTEVFAFPPGYHPTIHERTFGRGGLTAKAVVGLLPEQSRDLSGVTMYGKGRLFQQALKEGTVGFGTRGAAMIPASHPTTWRLLVFIYFEGPSLEIPWAAPLKSGYNPNNPHNKDIRTFIAAVAASYAAFTKVAKRLDILPYSKMWNGFTPQEIEQEVATYTRNSVPAPDFLAEAPHLRQKFDIPKEVQASPTMPTANVPAPPALNAALSRAIALGLNQRNADPRESKSPARLWTVQTLAARDAKKTASGSATTHAGSPGNTPTATVTPALALSSQADAEWSEYRLVTVRLPRAVITKIEALSGLPAAAFAAQAAEHRAARELDALIGVRTEHFRPILQVVRHRILDEIRGIQRIGLFGSVAKGTADRESDTDLLLVHPDPVLAQRKVNAAFQEFRHPAVHGSRYRISTQVVDEAGLAKLRDSDDPKVKDMMTDVIWLHPLPFPAVA